MKLALAFAAAMAAASALLAPSAGETPPGNEGERAFLKCYSCHSLEPGRNDLEGPSLHAIVGRNVAAEAGFEYSPALGRFARANPVWTAELLDRFLEDPEAVVPGTSMSFTGIGDERERAALLRYLRGHEGDRR